MYDYQVKDLVEVLNGIREELHTANRIEIIKSKYAAGLLTINELADAMRNIL